MVHGYNHTCTHHLCFGHIIIARLFGSPVTDMTSITSMVGQLVSIFLSLLVSVK